MFKCFFEFSFLICRITKFFFFNSSFFFKLLFRFFSGFGVTCLRFGFWFFLFFLLRLNHWFSKLSGQLHKMKIIFFAIHTSSGCGESLEECIPPVSMYMNTSFIRLSCKWLLWKIQTTLKPLFSYKCTFINIIYNIYVLSCLGSVCIALIFSTKSGWSRYGLNCGLNAILTIISSGNILLAGKPISLDCQ